MNFQNSTLGSLLSCFILGATVPSVMAGAKQWTSVASSPTSRMIKGIAYGNGKFVAAGNDGARIISVNGTEWQSASGSPQDAYLSALFASGQHFLTGVRFSDDRLSWSGIILSSVDGTSWAERLAAPDVSIRDVIHAQGIYVAVGGANVSGPTSSVARVFTSANGMDWTPALLGYGFWPYSISFGNGAFVGVGSGWGFRSTDATNWAVMRLPDDLILSTVEYGNGMFVAAGLNGVVATSPDGMTWTPRNSPTTEDLWDLAYSGSEFAAVGNRGAIICSPDGMTWTGTNATPVHLRGLAYGPDRAVAGGWYGTILTSASGQSGSNTPPGISPIANIVTNEMRLISFPVSANDTNVPPQTLAYSLDTNAPVGATIDASGRFRWRPREEHGPGNYAITVRVTDNGAPPLSSTATFMVTVNEVNRVPSFQIREQWVKGDTTLSFMTGRDDDLPPQLLTFSVVGNAPTGLAVNSGSGAVTWTPTDAQVGNHRVTIEAFDDGAPRMTNSFTYTIHVVPSTNVLVWPNVTFTNGTVTTTWQATVGKSYLIEYSTTLSPPNWQQLQAAIVADNITMTVPDPVGSGRRFYRISQLD